MPVEGVRTDGAGLDPAATVVEGGEDGTDTGLHDYGSLLTFFSRTGPALGSEVVLPSVALHLLPIGDDLGDTVLALKLVVRRQIGIRVDQLILPSEIERAVGLEFVEPRPPAVCEPRTLQPGQRRRNRAQVLLLPRVEVEIYKSADDVARLAGDRGWGFKLASPGGLHVLVVLLGPHRLRLGELRQGNKVPTFAGRIKVFLRAVELVRF